MQRTNSEQLGRRKHAGLFILLALFLFPQAISAAGDAESDAVATALAAEDELTKVIAKTSAAFVFIGGGSGVVVSADGYILTNHHVAGDHKQWSVRIEGSDKVVVCDLVGTDPVGDLALLKVRDAQNMAYVEFGDIGTVRVGQQVLAVGDPFKLAAEDGPPSFSLGTVSALHRFQENYSDAIQTDCAVNPGNSGGPLLTLDGKLIGITGQIMSRFGAKANTGIGYAIPVDQIARFYPLLKDTAGLVVYHGALPDGLRFSRHVEESQVAALEGVDANTDAERAGFKVGDHILRVDGKRVYNEARLNGIIRSYPENANLDVELEREGKLVKFQLKLPRMPLPPGLTYVAPVGVKLELSKNDGIRVSSVDKGSPAEKAGLMTGDIITMVDGRAPSLEWQTILLTKRPGEQLDVQIRRPGPDGGISQKSVQLILEPRR